MNVWLKRVVFGLVILVIAATVGLAIFLLTFNPNAYKSKLQDLVYQRYQRTLTIDGDIALSLFPRIGLSVRDVALSNRNGKDLFVSVDSARFAVAIWPLLSNQLVVDHVAVSGLKAWVTRDAEGRFNFSDLMASGSSVSEATLVNGSVPTALAAIQPGTDLDIDIAGLDLKGGQIRYTDRLAGLAATISGLEASTGRVTYDQPFDVSIKGEVSGQDPSLAAKFQAQALLRLNPAAQAYGAQKVNVQVSGRIANLDKTAIALKGSLSYKGVERSFSAANLELSVAGNVLGDRPVSGLKATLTAPQIRLDRRNSELKIDKLALRATGKGKDGDIELAFDAPALAISPGSAKGEPVKGTFKVSGKDKFALGFGLEGFSGTANELRLRAMTLDGGLTQGDRLVRLQLASPVIWDRSLRKGSLSAIKGDLSIRDGSSAKPSFEFPMIGSVHIDKIKDVLDIDLNAVIDGGQVAFKSQTRHLSRPETTFALQADKLNLNHWLAPPQAAAPAAPKGGAQVNAEGGQPGQATAVASAPAAESRIDFSILKGKDISGAVRIDDLRVRDIQLRKLSADIALQKDRLEVSKVSAGLYEGTLSGGFRATADQVLAAQLALDKVSTEPFLRALTGQGLLSGRLAARLDVQARGDTLTSLQRTLDGRASWQIRDGAVFGVSASQSLIEVSGVLLNVLKGQPGMVSRPFEAGRRTVFSSFDGRVDFQQGQGKVSRLSLVSDLVHVTEGKPAHIDLPGRKVDITLEAQISSRPPKAIAEAIGPLLGATVPLRISGPFDHLAYEVQWTGLRNQAIKNTLKNLIPGGILSPQASPSGGQTPPSASAPAKAPDPVKRIGDALKGLLGQ